MLNPYLSEFEALGPEYRRRAGEMIVNQGESRKAREWHDAKARLVSRYAWAVPTEEAIDAIAQHARRVLEVGAGNGYWAYLMAQKGIDVLAVDAKPAAKTWHAVSSGDERTARAHPDRALMLCWPDRGDTWASLALAEYRGDTVIHVGEFMRGTGEFFVFWQLWHDWIEVCRVTIPQWWNRSDDLRIYKRVGECSCRTEFDEQISAKNSLEATGA
jgi:SAM-dependent methyltransferase